MIQFAFALLFAAAPAYATPVLSYVDLEAIAKASVQEETLALNEIVEHYVTGENEEALDYRGYHKMNLRIFRKFAKPEGIEANVLFDVCLLTQETIGAITSPKISRANLKVTNNINAINNLQTSMNMKFHKIAERACLNARERFVERLRSATNQGVSLQFTETMIQNIARIVFFPAEFSRPTLTKRLLEALPILIQATMLVKGVSLFTGWAVNGTWLSMTSISGPALALKGLGPKPAELFKQKSISDLEIEQSIRIDLTPAEAAYVTSKN